MEKIKKTLVTIAFAIITFLANAQLCNTYTGCATCTNTPSCDLICNGSFDSHNGDNAGLPNWSCQVAKACGWNVNQYSPDFYYTGGTTNAWDVPCNNHGTQNDHTSGTGTGG